MVCAQQLRTSDSYFKDCNDTPRAFCGPVVWDRDFSDTPDGIRSAVLIGSWPVGGIFDHSEFQHIEI